MGFNSFICIIYAVLTTNVWLDTSLPNIYVFYKARELGSFKSNFPEFQTVETGISMQNTSCVVHFVVVTQWFSHLFFSAGTFWELIFLC
jgi:hypothetical protein